MINRYLIKEIHDIWSEENKYNNWLKIEYLNCEALNKIKIISDDDLKIIKNEIGFNIDDIYEIEKQTKHDLIAFTRAVSKYMKSEQKRWIHFGLTSTDIVDTSNAMNFKETNKIILSDLFNLKDVLIKQAKKYKYTYVMGRTHGMHAEIISMGFKYILWVDELNRLIQRFTHACDDIETGKISGAVGTFANLDPFIQDYICRKLGINSANVSTQVLQRDNHSFYFSVLNNIGLSIDKFSTELRHMHRSELEEVSEYFEKKQKGSSAMPHKKNPIGLENICGLSRLLIGYSNTIDNNVNLWHERDISHSSNERIIFMDATNTLVYIIRRFTKIVSSLIINEDKMLTNIKKSQNLFYSGKVLLDLIIKTKLTREEIYDEIQKVSFLAIKNKTDFKQEFKNTKFYTLYTETEFENLLCYENYLKHIDKIFKRVLNEE